MVVDVWALFVFGLLCAGLFVVSADGFCSVPDLTVVWPPDVVSAPYEDDTKYVNAKTNAATTNAAFLPVFIAYLI